VGNKNFIEINGKKYDAVTGRILDGETTITSKPQPVATVTPKMNSGVVDGFVRKPKNTSTSRALAKPASKQVQKSKTLMRTSVKKPEPVAKKIQASQPTISKSHLGTSVKRTQVAMQTPKSQHVQKYGEQQHRSSVAKTTNDSLTVKQQPDNHAVVHHSNATTTSHSVTKTQKSHSLTSEREKMINKALENANAHEAIDHAGNTHHKKKSSKLRKKLGISRKAASISSAVLAVVLLAGFFTIQNVPNLSMRIASTRAGFEAEMPGYKPSGFSFKGPINYSPGQVTVTFKSNSDSRWYDVKQQASNWNSDALLSNYVVAEGKTYQTYLDRGRTLFIYDGSNATWVDDGVWYQVEGDSDLTTDQLIRIASSI
jgi:hypothetical protein